MNYKQWIWLSMAKAEIMVEYIFREKNPMILGVKIIEGTFYENGDVWYNGHQYRLSMIQKGSKVVRYASVGEDAAFQINYAEFSKKCLIIEG